MGFSSVLGQATAVETLSRALQSGRVHHAYRFQGPEGVGKDRTALRLAQALVCESDDPLGCEQCSACRRALRFSEEVPCIPQHPDVLVLERGLYPTSMLGKSEATGISVEQVRTIVLPRIGMTPHEGQSLCVLIRNADELTQAAANALLKTLEEPPRNTHFILTTSRPGRLLDTILSRTQEVRFKPLDRESLKTLFAQQELPMELLDQCGGSLSRARELAEPEQIRKRDDFVKAADDALAAEHPAAALDFAGARPEGRDQLLALLFHLSAVFARRARSGPLMDVWAKRHELILHALNRAERNVSPTLVLEALMLRMRSIG